MRIPSPKRSEPRGRHARARGAGVEPCGGDRAGALVAAVLACSVAACAVTRPEVRGADGAGAPARVVRRPDGVALDPPVAVPPAATRARTAAVLALREPREDEALRELLAAYVRGLARGDLDALAGLLAEDAVPLGARALASRAAIVDDLQKRLRARDYARLAGVADPLRLDRIEQWDVEHLGLPGTPARPVEMRPGDVLVRVPVATPRVGGERLFGDAIVLIARREDGRLKIAGVQDDD